MSDYLFSHYRPHERQFAPSSSEEITKQNHKDECNIHTILKQFKMTGIINHINQHQAQFIDLPDGLDFQEAMNTTIRAQEAFAALPSLVRDRFNNNAGEFLAAFQDPEMRDELTRLGLLHPVRPPDPAGPTSTTTEPST